MKQQHVIKLIGIKQDRTSARISKEVYAFINKQTSVIVQESGNVILTTNKKEYKLLSHPSIKNLWTGVCNGVKVHFSKKAIIASLRYWS